MKKNWRSSVNVMHMRIALWKHMARQAKLLENPTPEKVREIFEQELFRMAGRRLKARKLKDREGFVVIATPFNYEHIFFKAGLFLTDRGERVYLIRETIQNSEEVIPDKDIHQRMHHLQPYRVQGVLAAELRRSLWQRLMGK